MSYVYLYKKLPPNFIRPLIFTRSTRVLFSACWVEVLPRGAEGPMQYRGLSPMQPHAKYMSQLFVLVS